MTFAEYLAIVLLLASASICSKKAPIASLAFLIAWIANLAYAKNIVASESIRWVSALVGLAGAVEFGRGVERTRLRLPVSIPDALRKVDGGAWIGCIAMASMGVDGFGMVAWRMFDVWIVPEATVIILVTICAIGLFGKENGR